MKGLSMEETSMDLLLQGFQEIKVSHINLEVTARLIVEVSVRPLYLLKGTKDSYYNAAESGGLEPVN